MATTTVTAPAPNAEPAIESVDKKFWFIPGIIVLISVICTGVSMIGPIFSDSGTVGPAIIFLAIVGFIIYRTFGGVTLGVVIAAGVAFAWFSCTRPAPASRSAATANGPVYHDPGIGTYIYRPNDRESLRNGTVFKDCLESVDKDADGKILAFSHKCRNNPRFGLEVYRPSERTSIDFIEERGVRKHRDFDESESVLAWRNEGGEKGLACLRQDPNFPKQYDGKMFDLRHIPRYGGDVYELTGEITVTLK
jgi:hypothetical protein